MGVLGTLGVRSRCPSSEAGRSDSFTGVGEDDPLFAFEGPLASLQGALKAIQTPRIEEAPSEEKQASYEAPIASLQSVLQQMSQFEEHDYASDQFGAPLADLQSVLK